MAYPSSKRTLGFNIVISQINKSLLSIASQTCLITTLPVTGRDRQPTSLTSCVAFIMSMAASIVSAIDLGFEGYATKHVARGRSSINQYSFQRVNAMSVNQIQ